MYKVDLGAIRARGIETDPGIVILSHLVALIIKDVVVHRTGQAGGD
jgi:hypothetical protein